MPETVLSLQGFSYLGRSAKNRQQIGKKRSVGRRRNDHLLNSYAPRTMPLSLAGFHRVAPKLSRLETNRTLTLWAVSFIAIITTVIFLVAFKNCINAIPIITREIRRSTSRRDSG